MQFLPESATKERALYDQFLMVIFNDIESLEFCTRRKYIDLAQHSSRPDLIKKIEYIYTPETASPAKYTFERSLKELEQRINKHGYILGDNFTTLDIHLLCDFEWAEALEGMLRGYCERVRAHEAYKTCWRMRQSLDILRRALPQNRSPPKGIDEFSMAKELRSWAKLPTDSFRSGDEFDEGYRSLT